MKLLIFLQILSVFTVPSGKISAEERQHAYCLMVSKYTAKEWNSTDIIRADYSVLTKRPLVGGPSHKAKGMVFRSSEGKMLDIATRNGFLNWEGGSL